MTDQKAPKSSRGEILVAITRLAWHEIMAQPLPQKPPVVARDGGEITCELCKDDGWWYAQYGSGWEAWQWWYCGPLGLDCPTDNG